MIPLSDTNIILSGGILNKNKEIHSLWYLFKNNACMAYNKIFREIFL